MIVQDKIDASWKIATEMLDVVIGNPGHGDDPAVVASAVSKLIIALCDIHDEDIFGLILGHLEIACPELFA